MSWDEIIKGTSGSDIINGGSGDDFLQGRAGGDVLDGGDGEDQLHGDAGDDFLRGGAGNDLLHGGLGTDSAVYSGSIFEYSFSADADSRYVRHSGGSMIDGYDRLISVERLVFADAVIDLTQNNAPVAFNDSASTNEDVGTYSSGSASVLANDFDWENQSLTATAGVFNGAYGTLTLNANGTYTYTPYASTQGLALGQVVQDSFSYTVSDGTHSDTGTLTIAVSGRNDAPVAGADSATGQENQIVPVNVLANDSDVDDGAVLTVTAASGPAGKGSVSIVGNQIQFNPGTDFNHLAQGASEVVVLNYSITDEHGAVSSSTVSVTVTGTNDGPAANPDSAAGTENQVLTIDALANDTDADDGAVKSLVSVSAPAGKGSASIVGGQVRFDPGADFDHLALGAIETVVLGYTMTDEHGATSTSTITVTITGTNDGPVASADVAATGENSSVSIAVLGNDSDADDGAMLTVAGASVPAGQGSVTVVGNQLEFNPGADFDHLAAGQSASVVVSYSVEDEHGASSSSTVTVTVNGANDPTTIDSGGTTATGAVAELANGDPGEGTAIHSADGVVAFDDVDLADTHGATATAQGSGYFGTFTLDPVDQAGDTVGWHFDVSDSEIDGLAEGEVVTQTYAITVSDGNGGLATQEVTVTITGAGDAAGPPWYIDNSAVGSTNVGSAANPFTSIAAFNAAQGTADGPAAGEQVFLLQGTGTYAEADGINLLDGQILTGIGDPTIAPTAGDGVNVGLGNSISGLNIASGGGDGIAGANVGGLSVADVDISTTGGIGIEIGSGSGVSIAGTTIISVSNYSILASNVAGMSLTNSVMSSGTAAAGTVAFTNLTGTADFLGTLLNGGGGDTLSIVNNSGSLSLTITDSATHSAIVGGNDPTTGDDGVSITTGGSASLTLVIHSVEFQGARDDLLEITANGSSSQNLTITGNGFQNLQASSGGGGGVELGGGAAGSNIDVDYRVEDNLFTGASGTAFSAAYTQQAGTVRGYIAGNRIGADDGVAGSQGSAGGDGISVGLQKTDGAGTATYLVTIVDNDIRDVDGGSGIALRSSGGEAANPAVMEATIEDNVVDELGDFALAALYAVVGGSAGSGDFARLGLALDGNVLDAGDADYGIDAIYLDQVSSDAHFYVPGYAGSGDGEFSDSPGTASVDLGAFWGASNTLVATPFSLFGGVDASIVSDLSGAALTQPAFFP